MKTSIIPVFIPHLGCPHRCVFCDQHTVTGQAEVPTGADTAQKIATYTRKKGAAYEVAFYGGSFTAVSATLQEELLQPAYEALQNGLVSAIRCSTRPDCIDDEVLNRLKRYGVRIVELGVQSMDDRVLQAAKRGHTSEDVYRAVSLLKKSGFTIGLQLMPGLPGEDWTSLTATTEAVCNLEPDFTRIYPVVVIANTELEDMYRRGHYEPLTIDEAVRRSAYMKELFLWHHIPCIRTGLQSTADLDDGLQVLAGAYAPAMGDMVDSLRYGRQIRFLLEDLGHTGRVTIRYNRRDTSRTRGYKNENMKLPATFKIVAAWQEDNSLPEGTVRVETDRQVWDIHTNTGERIQRS